MITQILIPRKNRNIDISIFTVFVAWILYNSNCQKVCLSGIVLLIFLTAIQEKKADFLLIFPTKTI